MKLTKFEHSCLILEKAGSAIVIDPGVFTAPLSDVAGVVAIVITHEHPDHWTPEHLARILDMNPGARVLGPAGVAAAATDVSVEVVAGGDRIEIEPFTLEFFGEKHALIHESIPVVDNVGVLVDDTVYYPGDSYTAPGVAVPVLATPTGAPWLKIGDVMDYVAEVKPAQAFPVHDMVLSVIGKQMANGRVKEVTEAAGGQFFVLEPGESLDL
jgi:L-ascorbate metabolism protein UlaG (beta-lactamase superfamily)